MSEEIVVLTSYWAAFILDIVIILYAFKLSKRMGGAGRLNNTTIYLGLSGLVFGIHHLLEIYIKGFPNGMLFAEGIEGIAAILLGLAVFQFYKLVKCE